MILFKEIIFVNGDRKFFQQSNGFEILVYDMEDFGIQICMGEDGLRGKIQRNSEEVFSMEIQRKNSEEKISKEFRGGSQKRNMQDEMRFHKSNSEGIQMRK